MKIRTVLVLLTVTLLGVYSITRVSGRVPADHVVVSAATHRAAGERIDAFVMTIADGDEAEQSAAVESLYQLLISDDPDVDAVAVNYTTELILPAYTIRPHAKRCALLLRAIPRLIARLNGRMDGKAYGILLYLQPYRPVPDRTTWEKWWQETGRAQFAAMAGTP